MPDCTFCRIVDDGSELIVRTPDLAAFLDIRPVFPGHVLIVPTEHVETLADLAPDLMQPLLEMAQRFLSALAEVVAAQGTFVAMNNVVSQSVPHLHLHVVPRRRGDGLRGFFWPRHPYRDDAERVQMREALKAAVARPA